MNKIVISVLTSILCFTAPVNAQGPVSLLIVSDLAGADEKKVIEVPEIYFYEKGSLHVTVPVPFEERYWICDVNLFDGIESKLVSVQLTDPKAIKLGENGTPFPLRVMNAEIPLVWNAPMTVIKIDGRSLTVTLTITDPPKKTSTDSKEAIKATKWGNVPDEILKQLDASSSFDHKNRQIRGAMYNPTQYRFTEFFIQIVVPKSEGFPGLDRVYRTLNIDGDPFSDGSFSVEALLPELPENAEPKITIKSAVGEIIR